MWFSCCVYRAAFCQPGEVRGDVLLWFPHVCQGDPSVSGQPRDRRRLHAISCDQSPSQVGCRGAAGSKPPPDPCQPPARGDPHLPPAPTSQGDAHQLTAQTQRGLREELCARHPAGLRSDEQRAERQRHRHRQRLWGGAGEELRPRGPAEASAGGEAELRHQAGGRRAASQAPPGGVLWRWAALGWGVVHFLVLKRLQWLHERVPQPSTPPPTSPLHAFLPHSTLRCSLPANAGEMLVPRGHAHALLWRGRLRSSHVQRTTVTTSASDVSQGRLSSPSHISDPHGLPCPPSGVKAGTTPQPGNQRLRNPVFVVTPGAETVVGSWAVP